MIQKERIADLDALDLLDTIIFKLDEKGDILFINRYALQLLQKKESEVIGKNFFDSCISQTEKAEIKEYFRSLQSNRYSKPLSITCSITTTTGTKQPILWKSSPYPCEGERCDGYLFWGKEPAQNTGTDRSDLHFKELVESLYDWVWELSLDGRLTYTSHRCTNILGYEPKALIGTSFFKLVVPEDQERIHRAYEELIGGTYSIERIQHHNLHKDSRTVILESSMSPIINDKGEVTGLRGVSRDITNSQMIYQRLIEATDKYQTLFNQLPVAVWLVDAETARFIDVNEASLKQYGYTKEEFLSLQIPQIDIYDSKEVVEARAQEMRDKGSLTFETGHRTKSGDVLDIRISATSLLINGRPVLSVTCEDFTDIKRQETVLRETTDKYRTLFNQLPEAVWLVDAETARFIDVNNASIRLYGYPKETFLNLRISDIDILESEEMVQTKTKEILKAGYVSFDTRHKTKTGKLLDMRVSIQPVTIENRPILSVTCQDLTELKANEAKLTELNRELENRVEQRTRELATTNRQLDKAQTIAHLGNWIWDIPSGKLSWSDEIYRIFGLKPRQFPATYEAFLESIHPDDVPIVTDGVTAALERDIPYDVEHRVLRPDGTIRFVREQGSIERDDDGNPLVMIGTVHDISEYKELIAEMTQTKERLETAQSISHIGNWRRYMDNDRVYWSDEVFRIFECPKTENNQIDYHLFTRKIHPQDAEKVKEEIKRNLNAGKMHYGLDYRIKIENGTIKYLHEEVIVFRNKGRITMLEGTVQDITRQVRAEQAIVEYNKILDEHVIASQTDLNGIITHASKAFCEISGYKEEELIGQNHNMVRHKDMPKELFEELWETILAGETWNGEIKNKKKDGSYYWVQSAISPRYDDEGLMIGFTAIREDITDKKRIEELSITDELTTLYNRRYFNQIFSSELQRAKRDGKILCFFIMDVDHFKRYNDTYGHQKGDDVLQQIGRILKQTMKRSGDYAFRLGGEEFGGVFSEKSFEAAEVFVQNICKQIEAKAIPHEKNNASDYVTASFGLVTADFSDKAMQKLQTDELYKAADDKLYEAKDSGRNRVCSRITTP